MLLLLHALERGRITFGDGLVTADLVSQQDELLIDPMDGPVELLGPDHIRDKPHERAEDKANAEKSDDRLFIDHDATDLSAARKGF